MIDTLFRITLTLVLAVQVICSIRYMSGVGAVKSLRQRDEGALVSTLLGLSYLGYTGGMIAYLLEPRWMQWSFLEDLPVGLRSIGVPFFLVGAAIAMWGLATLRANFAFSVTPRPQAQLVTNGPYRWVRHPLYTALLIQATGITLMMANWFVGLSAGLLWVLLAGRTRLEERKLIALFGDDYRRYQKQAGKYFPKLRAGRHG